MLSLRILHVGRRAADPLVQAADDYLTRLARYCRCEAVLVRERGLEGERDALLDKLAPGEVVVVLDERGRELSTVELAQWLKEKQRLNQTVTFVIGGADGLHPDVTQRAREKLSLSRFTLPHRLALVLLVEQLYRAHTLLRGEPYHRA